jgi:Protein of unknown function (DUF3306)
MSSKPVAAERFSLRRWSQRKLEAARAEVSAPSQTPPAVAATQTPAPATQNALAPVDPASVSAVFGEPPLPAIESLTIDSDFAPFLRPQVDESLKRAALKQLFRDPRFNVMDGLDTYIDDYSLPDPIPPAMLEDLMLRRGFFPPSGAETHAREHAVDEPARELPSSAEPIVAPVESSPVPTPMVSNASDMTVASSDAAIPDATESAPEADASATAAKS